MINKTLTIFTPTYNRANTIVRTYDSLRRQTSKDFIWIIIDDGSTDNTEILIKEWLVESYFHIRYIKKENGGLHTGYNVAIETANTELIVCIDADDYMPDNAVKTIIETWRNKGSDKVAGIIGLDFIAGTNKPIGGPFTDTEHTYHFIDVRQKLNHKGDIKMVIRTDLLKPHIPMKSIMGEKNFNPIYLFYLINPNLGYILINENLCFVEYQSNGMSANIFHQYRNSPYSFAEIRKIALKHPKTSFIRKFIDAAHLVSCSLIARDFKVISSSPCKALTLLSFPLGLLIYYYTMYKTSKNG